MVVGKDAVAPPAGQFPHNPQFLKTVPKPIQSLYPFRIFGLVLLDTPPYRNSRVCEYDHQAGLQVIGCRDLLLPAWLGSKCVRNFQNFRFCQVL